MGLVSKQWSKIGMWPWDELQRWPVLGELGTYKTVKAGFWRWRSGQSPRALSRCSLLAQRVGRGGE